MSEELSELKELKKQKLKEEKEKLEKKFLAEIELLKEDNLELKKKIKEIETEKIKETESLKSKLEWKSIENEARSFFAKNNIKTNAEKFAIEDLKKNLNENKDLDLKKYLETLKKENDFMFNEEVQKLNPKETDFSEIEDKNIFA